MEPDAKETHPVDDPNSPNSPDEFEGVRILGAQAAGPAPDAARVDANAEGSDGGRHRIAPRSVVPSAPSWDDEDDEEWGDDWDGQGVDGETRAMAASERPGGTGADGQHRGSPGRIHAGDRGDGGDDGDGSDRGGASEEWSTDDSGVWGDDETGALASGRAPLANTSNDADMSGGPRWRADAEDWSDGEELDDFAGHQANVGTLDPHRGDESDLYTFKELDEPVIDTAPPTAKVRKASSGDGMSGRSGAKATKSNRNAAAPPLADVVPAGLGARVVTAAGLIAAFVAVVLVAGRKGVTALVAGVLLMAAIEMFTALRHRGFSPAIVPGAVACFSLPLVAFATGETGMMLVLILTIFVTVLWSLFRVVRDRPVGNMSVTLMTVCYVGVLGGTAGLLLAHPNGLGLLLGGIACTVASDVVAFVVGANLGKIALSPEISPNKTVEGFVGGAIGSLLVGGIVFGVVGVAPWHGVFMGAVLGLVVGVLAPLGDLVESMIKRDLGIKDMGNLLPGHGGILDRIDAMLFVMPGIYFIARLKNWL